MARSSGGGRGAFDNPPVRREDRSGVAVARRFGPHQGTGTSSVSDEARLVEQAQQGDSAAFGQLVRNYQDRLFSSMLHVLGSADEAEDVTQDAFVQAYLKLATFKRSSSFYTWIYRIAFNRAITTRRRRREVVSVDESRESGGEEPLDTADGPGEQMMRQERARQIQVALGLLSEEHRAILVLREVEGCDYDMIAEILGITVGTVRSRLHRARSQMRDHLKQIHAEQQAD